MTTNYGLVTKDKPLTMPPQDSDYDSMFGDSEDESTKTNVKLIRNDKKVIDKSLFYGSSSEHEEDENEFLSSNSQVECINSGSSKKSDHYDIDSKQKLYGNNPKKSSLLPSAICMTSYIPENKKNDWSKRKLDTTCLNKQPIIFKTDKTPIAKRVRMLRPSSLNQAVKPGRRPTEYPNIGVEQFWRILRNWDFMKDLNDHAKMGSQENEQSSDGNCSDDSSDCVIVKVKKQKSDDFNSCPSLPDKFESPQQYKHLWSPLLLGEIKAQILSDFFTSCSNLIASPVKALPITSSNDRYSECVSFQLRTISGSNVLINERNLQNHERKSSTFTRYEFYVNDMVLLLSNPILVENACNGTLENINNKGLVSSLLSNSSPFALKRNGVLGTVANCSKKLDGLVVNISRNLYNSLLNNASIHVLRIPFTVNALREYSALCKIDKMPLLKYILPSESNSPFSSKNNVGDPLDGPKALGVGFRSYCNSKFNSSQKNAITAAAQEYGNGGFTLVKGPPGTGKTTTLVALINALHLRQYQRYYSEIERITIHETKARTSETLAAISAAAKVKPRILVCAPSNAAVDNVILKIMEDRFVDGNGGKYSPSLVRVGVGQSSSVVKVSLHTYVDMIIAQGTNPAAILYSRNELRRMQVEIQNLQRRVRALINATNYDLSRDWEIRIDEANFEVTEGIIFINHKSKVASLEAPPKPGPEEIVYSTKEMPHYRGCMDALVKYVERYNNLHSRLEGLILVGNYAKSLNGNYIRIKSELNQILETRLLDSMDIVMTTLGSAGSKAMATAKKFEVVVIDEAAQSSEPSTLVALQLGSSHAVLVGDPQQLPATIFSISGRVTKYDRSLFQRLEEAGHPVHMLNVQYRMNPVISSFPRRTFYRRSLLDGPNVKSKDYGGHLTHLINSKFRHIKPFTIFDLDSVEERDGISLSNTYEAYLTLHLFCTLDRETDGFSAKTPIAVITPYSQQVYILRRIFEEKLGELFTKKVLISTVDAFQGKEANIVIFSCVRGASHGVGIGFLSDVQRMNVALTRAKHYLFVIARCRTILVNPYWRDLVGHARKQQAIIKVAMKRFEGSDKVSNTNMMFDDLTTLKPFHQEANCSRNENHSDGNISA